MIFVFVLIVALNSLFENPSPILSDETTHFSARHPIFIQKIRPFPIIENRMWNGRFSARNFSGKSGKIKLAQVKKSLKIAMKYLPSEHLKGIKTLEVRNRSHVSRGMGNGEKIILHTKSIGSKKELLAVFLHELGHVVDIGILTGKSKKKSEFRNGRKPVSDDDPSLEFYKISWENEKTRRQNSNMLDFVSGYAMTDSFEDFAESYIFFRLHGEKFRSRAKKSDSLRKKYDFFKNNVFSGNEFQLKKKSRKFFGGTNFVFDTTLINFSMRDLISN